VVLQLLPQLQDAILQVGIGSVLGSATAPWLAGPIDAVEALALGAVDPALDGGQADAETASGLALGQTLSDGLDQPTPQSFPSVFWP
jgi:hypothetical protein